MKIAICDDLQSDIDNLVKQIDKYEEEKNKKLVVSTFTDGKEFIDKYEKKCYDVIFLDIYIGNISGIDIAREIRKKDEAVKIIFTTTSTEFFREGFEVNASNYLVKPVQYTALCNTMHRLGDLFKKEDDMLFITDNDKHIKIAQNSIIYIETIRNGVCIHFDDRFMKFRYSLSNVEKQLNPDYFLRSHRSYIINFNYVENITDDCFVMKNGSEVLIKQKDKKSIKEKYAEFYLKKISGEL